MRACGPDDQDPDRARRDHDVIAEGGTVHLSDSRYFVTSTDPGSIRADQLLASARNHWQVENSVFFLKDRWWDEDRHWTACLASRVGWPISPPPPPSCYASSTPPLNSALRVPTRLTAAQGWDWESSVPAAFAFLLKHPGKKPGRQCLRRREFGCPAAWSSGSTSMCSTQPRSNPRSRRGMLTLRPLCVAAHHQ